MNDFSTTLKAWRAARRYSQLDLAMQAEISARHLSFLETGRARPSREMVVRLGEALELPLDARNQMLTHAGFAIRYATRDWNDEAMAPIRRAVSRQLERNMPYPGLAVDRLWTIRQANPVAIALFAPFGVSVGGSLLDLMMSEILPQVVENWPEVAHQAALRLRTESAAHGGIPEFKEAIRYLTVAAASHELPPSPVMPTILKMGDQRLSMFATISQFGTPQDLFLDDLKIELYYPMDEATAQIFERFAAN
ncbi:helix-turn-helix domain-containing protein [uncultured Roseobacter sp.]|uniref:helix-turn-helix domain-containing protein n=1 Tax=uncultured Roseobacter sp. TaxID=114847 RepID=UPI002633110F|nr:helix-turn-helix domain-containing protein [uncultured Roseobacter sp.]